MNYPEELREKYNETLYQERDIIEEFLKRQYDLRYGRQRDSWHFEPAVQLLGHDGLILNVTDVRLSNDTFVVFGVKDPIEGLVEMECHQFAYGELSKIIEALPDAEDIVYRNAYSDIQLQRNELRLDLLLDKAPLNIVLQGNAYRITDIVEDLNGDLITICNGKEEPLSKLPKEVAVELRNHIHIEHLHCTKEYNEVVKFIALQEHVNRADFNYCVSVDDKDKVNYGVITFPIFGTDMTFDVSSIRRDRNGSLIIYGADIYREDELITLTETEIRPEYLEPIVRWIKKKTERPDIMDTRNAHDPELVRKINAAWKNDKYHDCFAEILVALSQRDHEEFENKYGVVVESDGEWAMNYAYEIMEGVCDDWDLETILSFIRYME